MNIQRSFDTFFMENPNHILYVVKCSDGSYYAGYTNDLTKRLAKHNQGKGAKYTRGRGPVTLVYQKEFASKSEALKAEYEFKQYSRKQKEKLISGVII